MHVTEKLVEVRYADTDQMGIVYHANYLAYCEMARAKLVTDLGLDYIQLEADGYLSPVLDIQLSYKQPLKYGMQALVKVWVEQYGRVRTIYSYEICHEDGTVAAIGKSTHAIVKKDSFRPVALSKVAPQWDEAYRKAAKELI